MRRAIIVFVLSGAWALAQTPDLRSVHKVFIDKMPNDLDQYLRAEFTKQFKGTVTVVLDEKAADAILTGVSEEEKGTGAKITGRYLGLHDVGTGSVTMVDKDRKVILWADEAGDRSLMFGVMKRAAREKLRTASCPSSKRRWATNCNVELFPAEIHPKGCRHGRRRRTAFH